MGEQAGVPGELICDEAMQIMRLTEYGLAPKTVRSGARPQAEGARLDAHVEGTATRPKLSGTVKGVWQGRGEQLPINLDHASGVSWSPPPTRWPCFAFNVPRAFA